MRAKKVQIMSAFKTKKLGRKGETSQKDTGTIIPPTPPTLP